LTEALAVSPRSPMAHSVTNPPGLFWLTVLFVQPIWILTAVEILSGESRTFDQTS